MIVIIYILEASFAGTIDFLAKSGVLEQLENAFYFLIIFESVSSQSIFKSIPICMICRRHLENESLIKLYNLNYINR